MINIVDLERKQNGGVVVVHWTASKTDGDFTASSYGTQSFEPDPLAATFTAFDDLTEEDIISWFSEDQVLEIETALDANLEAQSAPQVITGVPW